MMAAASEEDPAFQQPRRRGTIYFWGGAWHCTSHGDALIEADPGRFSCPRDACPTEVKVA